MLRINLGHGRLLVRDYTCLGGGKLYQVGCQNRGLEDRQGSTYPSPSFPCTKRTSFLLKVTFGSDGLNSVAFQS